MTPKSPTRSPARKKPRSVAGVVGVTPKKSHKKKKILRLQYNKENYSSNKRLADNKRKRVSIIATPSTSVVNGTRNVAAVVVTQTQQSQLNSTPSSTSGLDDSAVKSRLFDTADGVVETVAELLATPCTESLDVEIDSTAASGFVDVGERLDLSKMPKLQRSIFKPNWVNIYPWLRDVSTVSSTVSPADINKKENI